MSLKGFFYHQKALQVAEKKHGKLQIVTLSGTGLSSTYS